MSRKISRSTETQQQEAQATAAASPVERDQMVAIAAYFLAERRVFSLGMELEDLFQAEKEIDARLAALAAGVERAD